MTALVLAAALSASPVEPLFRDQDRVVFLGDSITVLHTWTRLVELAVRLRHPEWTLTFINAGVGGNTAEDAVARLDVDVLAHKPTVVFVNFGMNDASFPDGSSGADFQRNMTTLLDRLEAAKVRRVVWLDPTPFDTSSAPPGPFNRRRVERLSSFVTWVKETGAARGLTVVPVHDAVTRAIAGWKAAKRTENLIPDRIHPGPVLHGVMAAETLAAVGFDVAPGRVTVPASAALDGGVGLEFELSSQPAPLPFVLPLADARVLDSKSLVSLGSFTVAVTGLPPKQKFRVKAGTVEVGRFTGAQLGQGVDVMQSAPARIAPGPERADLAVCETTTGHPWANDVSCLFNLLFGKDQLRITMRHEKTRGLPDSVPGYLERLSALQAEWIEAVDRDVERRVRALRERPHRLVLEVDDPGLR
ncbi:MAG: SGNH/GDSL hydrolase family protein [Myxococcaceae bacterium]|nr:SGNH/GDSL hydrolase family protein [Myxococcaceae bacterium]